MKLKVAYFMIILLGGVVLVNLKYMLRAVY